MPTRTASRSSALLLGATLIVGLGPSWPSGAQSSAGLLTKIGGQGPTGQPPCDPTSDEFASELKTETFPAASDIGGNGYNISTGMQGIAVDVTGQHLFLAAGNRIVDRTGVVAGRLLKLSGGTGEDPTAPDPSPVNGASASFPGMTGIAVDPRATTLWAIQGGTGGSNLVRKIDLSSPAHPVTTVTSMPTAPTAVAADAVGNVYVAEASGAITKLGPIGAAAQVGNVRAPSGLAVDATGSQVFVSGGSAVYRLQTGSAPDVVVGDTTPHADGGAPGLAQARGLAVGYQVDGSGLRARYLYIADTGNRRVLRVDFQSSPPTITTVAGGGSTFVSGSGPATTAAIDPQHVAADDAGHLYIDSPNQCAIYQLDVPPPFAVNTVVSQPSTPVTTVKPADPGASGNPKDVSGTQSAGAASQNGSANQTQIVSGSQAQTGSQAVDLPTSANATQIVQPTPQPAPGPTPAAAPAPAPVAAAAPVAAPTPAATPAAAPLPAPAPAPVPPPAPAPAPAPAPVPPPAAPAPAPIAPSAPLSPGAAHPVANVGLAGGDAPIPKGGARYAMVRAGDDRSSAAATLAVAGGGLALAVFVCVLFLAPDPSSKPKPRPRGAY